MLQRFSPFGPLAGASGSLVDMHPRRNRCLIWLLACGNLLVTRASPAHIDLLSPLPRVGGAGNANLDRAPCGQRNPGRSSGQASTFRPGETITVVWDAYVQHPGYFRLAFDLEGDDSFSARSSLPADPERDDPRELVSGEDETILDYVEDHPGELEHVEHAVTLPSMACDVCTLQLTQFIYNVPLDEATYYQCADIALVGEPIPPAVEPVDASPASAEPSVSETGCSLRAGPAAMTMHGSALSALVLSLLHLRRGACWRATSTRRTPSRAVTPGR
jgi:Lytic polysaccharide mono-oxygenase, cellulose-degrading